MASVTRVYCDRCKREVKNDEYWDNKISVVEIKMSNPAQAFESSSRELCGGCRKEFHAAIAEFMKAGGN